MTGQSDVSALKSRVELFGATAIAITTSLYVLGYLSWALFAWSYRLGSLPVLNSQYLIAGMPPALVLLLVAVCAVGILRFANWLKGEPTDMTKKWARLLRFLGQIFITVSLFVAIVEKLFSIRHERIGLAFLYSGLGLITIAVLLSRRNVDKTDRFWQRLTVGYGWMTVVMLAIVAFTLYFGLAFKRLPAELGGPAPQCVRLDIDTARLSAEARREVLVPSDALNNTGVYRSKRLFLVLSVDGFFILSPEPHLASLGAGLFRLDRTTVVRREDCDAILAAR